MFISILGMIISFRRKQMNLSLKELSQLTDISIGELSHIEKGRIKAPSSVFLYRIANVLKLNYENLLKYKYASYYRKKDLLNV